MLPGSVSHSRLRVRFAFFELTTSFEDHLISDRIKL